MDMASLNTRVGWAANTNSSLGWFGDNTKPTYRSYGLENMAGYYWYQSNRSGWRWDWWNCNGTVQISNDYGEACGPVTSNWAYRLIVGPNCCQDGALVDNCNCNCVNNCGNCYDNCVGYAVAPYVYPTAMNCGSTYQCVQCDISGNCDSRAWMQPNCNCLQCNCACNCMNAGQCTQTNCNCDCG